RGLEIWPPLAQRVRPRVGRARKKFLKHSRDRDAAGVLEANDTEQCGRMREARVEREKARELDVGMIAVFELAKQFQDRLIADHERRVALLRRSDAQLGRCRHDE